MAARPPAAHFAPESAGTTAIITGLVAMGAISTDLYLPSLPALGRELGAATAETQLTLSVFLIGFALAQLGLGPLSDRFGRRPVLAAGVGLYLLASLLCALAPSIELLIVARGVQAIGACSGVVIGRAVVRDIYGRERAARVLAYIGSAMALLPTFGPVLGGFIQAWLGWRWNFGVLAGFSGALFLALWLRLAETNAWLDASALDPLRLLSNYGRLARDRVFFGFALAVAFSYAGLFTFISGSSFVLIEALGVPEDRFGFFFGAAVFGYIAGTQVAAKLTLRLGIERMVALGAIVALTSGVAMATLAWAGLAERATGGAYAVVGPMIGYMIGIGIVLPNANAGAIGPYPTMAGAASALVGFTQMSIAAAVGVAVGHLHDGTARPMASLVAASAAALGLAYLLLVRERPSRATSA